MGYAMAMVSTTVLAYLAFRARTSGFMARWIDPEVSSAILAIPISLGTTLVWTMFGMMIGSAYELGDFKHKGAFLGSPSGPFLLLIASIAWLPLPPLIIFIRHQWPLWVGTGVAFVVLFGWAMPLLAAR